MSDADVRLILKEKNIEITKNKLVLDIENNMDSLKQNIENILNLEMANIERNVENNFSVLISSFITSAKKECMLYFKKQIEEIILLSREFIYKESLTKNFIWQYEKHLQQLDSIFSKNKEELNVMMKQVITEKISKEIDLEDFSLYILEKMEEKILQKVNMQYKERTNIIINNAKETYNKYLLLNKKTN